MSLVRVTFIDAGDGEVIAESDVPVDELPDSFAEPTTIHLGDNEWRVERAEPVDRAGFGASKRLTLTLQRVMTIDPGLLRYSLPTIEDRLPVLMQADTTGAFELREDDWRQREFVSKRFSSEVDAELADIEAIIASGDGFGFENIHIRSRINDPLAGVDLPVATLRSACGDMTEGPLAMAGGLVAGGFYFATSSGVVYGQLEGDSVATLGIAEGHAPDSMLALANQHGLLVVDWVQALATGDGMRRRGCS
jgi:hypothetical protein